MPETMTHAVAVNILNLRAEPGLPAEIRQRLQQGTRVRMLLEEWHYASGLNWQAIETESGSRGWVDGQFLQPINPVELSDHKPWYA